MELNNKLCSICHINQYKYKCPACSTMTCSVECIRRHKKQTDCTGIVDQTRFISKKNLSSDIVHINRDYNFLLNLDRTLKVGKEDVKQNAKNIFKRVNHGPQRGSKRIKNSDQIIEDPRLTKVHKIYTHSPNTVIKRQNTLIIQVPVGMSRAASNKTGYDKKLSSFTWTIEWILIGEDGEEIMKFLSYRLKEHLILEESIPLNILNNSKVGKEILKENLRFYLNNVVHSGKGKRSLIQLENSKQIGENLKDKIVLEYPTIYVTLNDMTWKEFVIPELAAYGVDESDSSSSSDSDSDSSSDSGSDSSSDSDSDANSDSALENEDLNLNADHKLHEEREATSDEFPPNKDLSDSFVSNTKDIEQIEDDDSAPEESSSKEPTSI